MPVDLSIVVAVYNEDPRNLDTLIARLGNALSPLSLSWEIVFVNDGSRQPTSDALEVLANRHDRIKLVVLSRNFGQQAAISAGIDHSEGRAVVNIDSDCQDPPEFIPKMVELWRQGYDVVYAQRQTRKDKLGKRLFAYWFYRVLGALSSIEIPWDTGDFRLIDRRVLQALNDMPEKSRFLRGQIPWLGFRQIGIRIERGAREVGASTYTLRKLCALAMDGILGFSVAPLYMVLMFGLMLLGIGAVAVVGCVAVSLAWHKPVHLAVWSAAFMAVLAGFQTSLLGVVAVYLSKIVDEVRARPIYVVARRTGSGFSHGKDALDASLRSELYLSGAVGRE
jgi:dolichol-phosphate mannosyltransferase